MVFWIERLADWDGRIPAVLIRADLTPDQRRASLRAMTARALGIAPEAVVVEHADGRPPAVTLPPASGLFLSSATREPFTALAVAASPIGADVELVDAHGEIPWRLLHPLEAAALNGQVAQDRAQAFTRIWSLKEAYLKALGVGLFREPSSFAARLTGEDSVIIDDPSAARGVTQALTTWRTHGDARAAVSVIVLRPAAILPPR